MPREAARLQSFPDWFEFAGGETSIFNQIGNAVAPYFAYQLAKAVKAYFMRSEDTSSNYFIKDENNQLRCYAEVWIADNPDHLIHFDGDKFLGPYTVEW